MTDTSNSAPISTLRSVNLDAEERRVRSASNTDFAEAKEAVVDALLELTVQKCTGAGPTGERVFAAKPSAKFVSGFLLPRFDATGFEDETSDIHLSTMGVDLQVAANHTGAITIAPELSVYIRELPTWQEISDPRHDMMPRVELSRETRQTVEDRARQYINEAIAALPPLEEPAEPDERPGNDAVQARIMLDQADEAADETPADVDRRGQTQVTRAAAQRAEEVSAARQQRTQQQHAARRERNAAIAVIRREAFTRAFQDLGITLVPGGQGGANARPLTADDLAVPVENTGDQVAIGAPEAVATPQDDATAAAEEGTPEAVAADAPIAVRQEAGVLADHVAEPQPIPMKWRRFRLALGEFQFECHDEASRLAASAAFSPRLFEALRAVLTEWLATDEGQRDAYRPNERVLPSNFASEQSWNAYLAALRQCRLATIADIIPDLTNVALVLEMGADFVDAQRVNLRVAIENGAQAPAPREFASFEPSLFQVSLGVTLPTQLHLRLQLDRVQPSYRFREWLTYPAMGLNCGIELLPSQPDLVRIGTTWAPRYQQPRIDPTSIEGLPVAYADLADPSGDVGRLFRLPDHYDAWISQQALMDAGQGLPEELAERERQAHAADLEAYRRESGYIRAGVELLQDSCNAARALGGNVPLGSWSARDPRAAPWEAWLLTNEAFMLYGGERYTEWRLFQLAFILAHVPTLASRMPAFADCFDAHRDELSASLLYFATGGGKSEAFFGLLVFNLFIDRLRGKHRGVTALVRYPLRLLTLQQARRLMRILAQAELVRIRRRLPGAPFEIGFWVGSGNTPNRAAQGFGGVPLITRATHPNDTSLLNPPSGSSETAKAARRASDRYREALESFDKLRVCPCCNSPTGMRRYPNQEGRVGIVCFNDACAWNRENPPAPHRVPLPFLLTDDTIYQRAPSVILGTVDKLALIGQHDRTINAITGMLGAARYIDPTNRHLHMPRGQRALSSATDEGWRPVKPAFSNGVEIFHDPFPSLVIQDEGHLLEESLGTFSGLFETTFESILLRLGSGILRDYVSSWQPDPQSDARRPRLAKVIAATATISDPDRQLRVLYQREPLRFPCSGPSIYESFYAMPRAPLRMERRELSAAAPAQSRTEQFSPRMRTYVSIMTNGRSHTMTTSAVVSAYHLALTELWQTLIEDSRTNDVVAALSAALPINDPLTPLRQTALQELAASPNGDRILANTLDLQRISLTYVTNKKGGDQIIETLQTQVERDQRTAGITDLQFLTELISGGVTIAEIQDVMQKAEGGVRPGEPFPPLGDSLRNIVATSAISHGVDVDKFNAMFFAGLPSDIAEYIQASSRVGRTHVGFSLLVPTPHSRRDRYVVETHDQFHRFLERMIPPPAVQRWAERAIRRAMPSILQAYLCAVVEQELFAAATGDKSTARSFTTASQIKAWADQAAGGNPGAIRAATQFALEAIGIDGRGSRHTGAPTHGDHYRTFVEDRMREILDIFTRRSDGARLSSFWESASSPSIRKPMTSLRDVDEGGTIVAARRDPWRNRNVHSETTRLVMRVIRGQRVAARSDVDADTPPVDSTD